jgi:hypothetical protein
VFFLLLSLFLETDCCFRPLGAELGVHSLGDSLILCNLADRLLGLFADVCHVHLDVRRLEIDKSPLGDGNRRTTPPLCFRLLEGNPRRLLEGQSHQPVRLPRSTPPCFGSRANLTGDRFSGSYPSSFYVKKKI